MAGEGSWTWVQRSPTATSALLREKASHIHAIWGESDNPDFGPGGISETGLDIFQNILAVAGVVPFRFPRPLPAPPPRLNFVAVFPRFDSTVYINLQTLTLQTHLHPFALPRFVVSRGRKNGLTKQRPPRFDKTKTFGWGKTLEADGRVSYYNATTGATELPVDSTSLEFLALRPADKDGGSVEPVYIDLSTLDRADPPPTGAGAQSGSWVKFIFESEAAASSDHYVPTWDEDQMAVAENFFKNLRTREFARPDDERQGSELSMQLRTSMPENMIVPPCFRWGLGHSGELKHPGPLILSAVWDTWGLQAAFNGTIEQTEPPALATPSGGYSEPVADHTANIDVPLFLLPSGSVRSTIDALNGGKKPSDSRAMSYCKRNGFAVMSVSEQMNKYFLLWRGDRVTHWDNIQQTLEQFGVRFHGGREV